MTSVQATDRKSLNPFVDVEYHSRQELDRMQKSGTLSYPQLIALNSIRKDAAELNRLHGTNMTADVRAKVNRYATEYDVDNDDLLALIGSDAHYLYMSYSPMIHDAGFTGDANLKNYLY